MNVYVYRAALWCESCANDLMAKNHPPVHVNMNDESSYDSDEWPKGPFPDGGGESDTPQHCDGCGVFLENMLTDDGALYVQEMAEEIAHPGETWSAIADRADSAGKPALAEWIRFYFAPGM